MQHTEALVTDDEARAARAESTPVAASEGFEEFINVKRAAQFLGVSASLVYAFVERKQIPHYRMMGRVIRFRRSELDRWLDQFKVHGGIDE